MSELLARVRAQLAHAQGKRMLAVAIDCDDLEALLVIAEQPALSLTARWVETSDESLDYDAPRLGDPT